MSRSIAKAKPSDLGEILSLYTMAVEAMEPALKPTAEERESFVESWSSLPPEESVFVLHDGRKIIGFLHLSHSLSDSFFPKSHSFSKTNDLIYDIGFGEEEILVIKAFCIEPKNQNRGFGTELLQSAMGRYPKSSWALLTDEKNVRLNEFWIHRGFLPFGNIDAETAGKAKTVYYRKYTPFGLCREARW